VQPYPIRAKRKPWLRAHSRRFRKLKRADQTNARQLQLHQYDTRGGRCTSAVVEHLRAGDSRRASWNCTREQTYAEAGTSSTA